MFNLQTDRPNICTFLISNLSTLCRIIINVKRFAEYYVNWVFKLYIILRWLGKPIFAV